MVALEEIVASAAKRQRIVGSLGPKEGPGLFHGTPSLSLYAMTIFYYSYKKMSITIIFIVHPKRSVFWSVMHLCHS